jgi:hypothetical protein
VSLFQTYKDAGAWHKKHANMTMQYTYNAPKFKNILPIAATCLILTLNSKILSKVFANWDNLK